MSFVFPSKGQHDADELIRVVDYLDALGTCVETDVCDAEVVRRHLTEYVDRITCLYEAPLRRLREEHGLSSLGIAMQAISVKEGCN